ncbi:Protein GLUTAMINE DUMPER 3 like [Actinidia chinensis var. chinensis]|uniref:Protein GLUTAMINE DUMPER 3 like n=1 Tax=Actinidia chinensis var. chinensis TaxID=1590841 RepID=A0A2R6RYH8_ACTCC|nr:Protein GLUTAMINE DUMPER 3 like [Actinidia chinensis var. chinensis]
MRHISTPPTNSVWKLNSPTPYLFGGMALVLGLITVALLILVCSYRKQLSSNLPTDRADGEKMPEKTQIMEADLEPKFLVIMAGDNRPSFIATPV